MRPESRRRRRQKLERSWARRVGELGATLNAALVVIGDKLGLYRALAGAGAADPGRARRAHRHRRALRPRVAQRPGGRRLRRLRRRRPAATRCRPSRPSRSTDENSPAFLPGALPDRARRVRDDRRSIAEAFAQRRRASAGTSTTTTCSTAASASSGPATTRTSSPSWLPALDGVVEQARAPARRVADVGCGHGASTILMAQAFPNSTFVGFDYHAGSIETRARAGRATPASPTA